MFRTSRARPCQKGGGSVTPGETLFPALRMRQYSGLARLDTYSYQCNRLNCLHLLFSLCRSRSSLPPRIPGSHGPLSRRVFLGNRYVSLIYLPTRLLSVLCYIVCIWLTVGGAENVRWLRGTTWLSCKLYFVNFRASPGLGWHTRFAAYMGIVGF